MSYLALKSLSFKNFDSTLSWPPQPHGPRLRSAPHLGHRPLQPPDREGAVPRSETAGRAATGEEKLKSSLPPAKSLKTEPLSFISSDRPESGISSNFIFISLCSIKTQKYTGNPLFMSIKFA